MFIREILFLVIVALPVFCFARGEAEMHKVIKVSDNGLLYLENGEVVELAEIIISKEFNKSAVNIIKEQAENKQVKIVYRSEEKNRYDRYLSYVYNADNLLQNILLERGLANYYPMVMYDHTDGDFLLAEATARDHKKGLWRRNVIISSVEAEQNIAKYRNKFKIVEGVVVDVKQVRDKLYLNFGQDWKTDFTTVIRKENLQNFPELDFESLIGKTVRVRGWMELYNGSAMEIYNAGHIQVLLLP